MNCFNLRHSNADKKWIDFSSFLRGQGMAAILKTKLRILFLLPQILISVSSGLFLYFTERTDLLFLHFFFCFSGMLISSFFLNNMIRKLSGKMNQIAEGIETVNYSAILLSSEAKKTIVEHDDLLTWKAQITKIQEAIHGLENKQEALNEIYIQLKNILHKTLREGKTHLALAKELAGVCTMAGQSDKEIQKLLNLTSSEVLQLKNKLTEGEEKARYSETTLLISDCIAGNSRRILLDMKREGLIVKPPRKNQNVESTLFSFKAGSLRKAIKLAEKRAA
jgi:hypothetical protein